MQNDSRKIALDIHGVIDAEPEFFSWLSHHLHMKGWEVHIVTGGRLIHNKNHLFKWNIKWDHFYSITDHHIELGTPIVPGCPDGQVCIEDRTWNMAKGLYCREHDISILVDDSLMYKKYLRSYQTHFEHW